jgi:hypothetical protein
MRFASVRSTVLVALAAATLFLLPIDNALAGATMVVVNNDGAGEGLNDATAFTPVGGNPAVTLGQARLVAMQHAAFLWGSRIESDVEIQIGAAFDPLFCLPASGTLGMSGPETAHRDFVGAPLASTWYVQSLANALAGADLSATVDMGITYNSRVGTDPTCLTGLDFYYGLDGNNPANTIDFVTVILHEISHGLGFLPLVDLQTGEKFNGRDDAYIMHLEHDGATPSDYPGMTDAQRVAASTADPDLHWVGNRVSTEAAAIPMTVGLVGGEMRMHGPAVQEPGSSVSHFTDDSFPNLLMEPDYTDADHELDLTLPLLEDIGWTLQPLLGTDVVFLMDVTGSTGALLPEWVNQIADIAQDWLDFDSNARFAVASHVDFPYHPHGLPTDWAYRVDLTFTNSIGDLQDALDDLENEDGADTAESQYEAIYQVLTGSGRDLVDPVDYLDLGEIPPESLGQLNPMVIYHFTHPEVFHDRDLEPDYPFPGSKVVAGRTLTTDEIAVQSSLNMFFGLTFLTGLRDGESPLEELARLSRGAVYVVDEDLGNLGGVMEQSIEHWGGSPQGSGDLDGDGVLPPDDNCPLDHNPDQLDWDHDGVGDACDHCPRIPDRDQKDANYDQQGDACVCPEVPYPVSQGYWHRQCLGVPESDGGIDPGRNGRGPTSPTEPEFVERLMLCADLWLEDVGFYGTSTCEGMDATPPSDQCEKALKKLTALILNMCSTRVAADCLLDLAAYGCDSTNVGDLIIEATDLIQAGQCTLAASCANAVNEGEALAE